MNLDLRKRVLTFKFTIILQNLSANTRQVMEESIVSEIALTLRKLQSLLQTHDEDFLKSYLSNPLSLPYFTSDNPALLTHDVKDDIRQLFNVSTISYFAKPIDREIQVFQLALKIVVNCVVNK